MRDTYCSSIEGVSQEGLPGRSDTTPEFKGQVRVGEAEEAAFQAGIQLNAQRTQRVGCLRKKTTVQYGQRRSQEWKWRYGTSS